MGVHISTFSALMIKMHYEANNGMKRVKLKLILIAGEMSATMHGRGSRLPGTVADPA